MRVVLDTSVIRAGFVSASGSSRWLLDAAFQRRVTIVASTALFLQYEDVLMRPETLVAARASPENASDVLRALAVVCGKVKINYAWRPLSPDPGDDLVLEAAINGLAKTIATFDIRHLRIPAARFDIAVETPAQVLERMA